MGRYTQRQRRGGGASAAAAPPPVILEVVVISGDSARVVFDRPVTLATIGEDNNFRINLNRTDTQAQTGAAEITVTNTSLPGWSSGLAWELNAQPAWLLEPIDFPAAGVTS